MDDLEPIEVTVPGDPRDPRAAPDPPDGVNVHSEFGG